MQPSDAFGVALRILGLWFLYVASNRAFFLAWEFYTARQQGIANTSFGWDVKIAIGFHLFLALILLAGTDKVVRLFYPRPS